MSTSLKHAEYKLDIFLNQELYEFTKKSGSFLRQKWFKIIRKSIERKNDAPDLYWDLIVDYIKPFLEDSKYTGDEVWHLITLYFTSIKFSKMRNLMFADAEVFYKNTIRLVQLLQASQFDFHSADDRVVKISENRRDEILNICYYTDWFLYKMIEGLFYPEGNFVLDSAPRSYIKNIAFQIVNDYRFDNSPYPSGSESIKYDTGDLNIFIGRRSIVDKFLAFLQIDGKNKKGVYLVTGYRGMGKTSFVNRVINIYKNTISHKKYKVIPVTISLAQRQPSEVDILHLMVSHLKDKLDEIPRRFLFPRSCIVIVSQLSIIILLVSFCGFFVANYISRTRIANKGISGESNIGKATGTKLYVSRSALESNIPNNSSVNLITYGSNEPVADRISIFDIPESQDWWLGGIGIGIITSAAVLLLLRFMPDFLIDKSEEQIKTLFERCYASISRETSDQSEFSLEQLGAKFSANGNKQTSTYPLASSKEIEYELIKYLAGISDRAEFIFIFDELDKIEPAAISTSYLNNSDYKNQDQGAYLEQIRERKQAIINIIAGLKNFLTTAEARFIFIAGREMFDATLADVSDRQSSVGSIFNYVFYVQSFLRESIRDEIHSRGSMGQMIENYISKMLINKKFSHPSDNLYKQVFNQFFRVDLAKLEELRSIIKNNNRRLNPYFYLIYGTNLSNKYHAFIDEINIEHNELSYQMMKAMITLQNLVNYLTYRSNGSPKKIIKTLHEFIRIKKFGKYDDGLTLLTDRSNVLLKDKPYIFLNMKDQYRLGFINHLFRPFIVKNGESFKKYSDNIIISTTYLFDHLLKFHPFAFSFGNLELIPEVLSTNKTPSLRDHIITIIEYLSNNHLRETEIGIFDYKFYSRTVNELIYISKTFEEESAAFNFTLDEGFLVKLHVRNELKELRKVYSAFAKPKDILNSAFSITHLNGILGDLHFFDQEYDDAIVAYSNAVNELRHESERLSVTDFVVLIRFLLKLGLTFEKVKNYDEALAFYSDAAEESKKFIINRLGNDQQSLVGEQLDKSNTSVFSDLLQIVNQAFIAKIVLQEKMGVEGITSVKFGLAIGGFLRLSGKVGKISGRNSMITANLYLVLANLIYFKNSYSGFKLALIKENGDYKAFLNAYEPTELFKFFVLRSTYEHFTKFPTDNKNVDPKDHLTLDTKRMPALSLWYYVIGLAEVIRSRLPERESLNFIFSRMTPEMKMFRIELMTYHTNAGNLLELNEFDAGEYANKRSKNLIYDILQFLNKNSIKNSETFTKGHHKYIAMFTSHIGDCFLSMVHVEGQKGKDFRNFLIEEIFDKARVL